MLYFNSTNGLGLFMQISSFLLLIYSKGIVANIEIYFESA